MRAARSVRSLNRGDFDSDHGQTEALLPSPHPPCVQYGSSRALKAHTKGKKSLMTFEGLLAGVASPPAPPQCGVPDRRTEGLKDGQWNANPLDSPAALAAAGMPPKGGGGGGLAGHHF